MRQINEENLNDTGVVLSTVNPSEMGKMFSYNGINVRMRKMNGYILVCLTDFARLFPDKNLSTIINSKEMTDYVNRLSEIKNFISTDLLEIMQACTDGTLDKLNIEWEDKKNLVENGDIDCIWGCFSIKGRENDYKWTKPYMVSRQGVAVNKSSNIYSLSDLEGKIIAVQSTTKPEEIFLNPTDSKIPEVKEVFSVEDREQIYTYLGKGYVDAISAHETAIRQYMQDYDMDYRILDESIFVTGIGAAFAINDDRGIEEKLSEKFDEMQKDGTMEIIVSKYLSNAYKYLEVDSLE